MSRSKSPRVTGQDRPVLQRDPDFIALSVFRCHQPDLKARGGALLHHPEVMTSVHTIMLITHRCREKA
ncbi:hypothetical protein PIIN_09873 [Serendipita indica DSM 11827]|uniref:Uncharacterized protein n=1 Tax=Serendipita indica (strain DSM 11827) TaxID=1109443 RepID=G4TX34_SERID|nr:hypothetical protein PIIN_09873 [Serendipita indica DSM 11827]